MAQKRPTKRDGMTLRSSSSSTGNRKQKKAPKAKGGSIFSMKSCSIFGVSAFVLTISVIVILPQLRPIYKPDAQGSGVSRQVPIESRASLIKKAEDTRFDVVIIGGGSSGAAAALEAVSRGLKVALVEMEDFSSGTSSRSTKLLHGGVRYLKKAVEKLDSSQFYLVREALAERSVLMHQAPHLTNTLAIVQPLDSWKDLPLQYFELMLYDWLSNPRIHSSSFISREETKKRFPQLKPEGFIGSIEYYDAQFDDARFNLMMILTAQKRGAVVLNYMEAKKVLHDSKGRATGIIAHDRLGNQKDIKILGKAILNAGGPFADEIRKLASKTKEQGEVEEDSVVFHSAGAHIVIDQKFCPSTTGLLIPKTEDKRVVFLLPWKNSTLVGTTDGPTKLENNPRPTEEQIEYIIRQVNKYFSHNIDRSDVLSAWSGIRALRKTSKGADDDSKSAQISREHGIYVGKDGMLTIVGGKWTTVRGMGRDFINKAIEESKKTWNVIVPKHDRSDTATLKLIGAKQFNINFAATLAEKWSIDIDVATELNSNYGDQSAHVAALDGGKYLTRLVDHQPYTEAQVIWAVRNEHAHTPVDVLERRTRMSVRDSQAALDSLPRVVELMGKELGWGEVKMAQELKRGKEQLAMSVK